MSSRKHHQLKRHPLIRFIRSILRLIRSVFRPKKRPSRSVRSVDRSIADEPLLLAPRRQDVRKEVATELLIQPKYPLVGTVGELFDLVQWQIPPVITQPISKIVVARTSSVSHAQHSSIATVGELIGQVKWQILPATSLEQSSNPNPMAQTHDVSIN